MPAKTTAPTAGSGTADTPLPVGNAAPWMPTLKSMMP
jgi:hypothetical protein